jgi:hypothetical protein
LDLVVVGGQLGDRGGLEGDEFGDLLVEVGDAGLESGVVVLEPGDLDVAWVGEVSLIAWPGQPLGELVFEVGGRCRRARRGRRRRRGS